MKKKLTSLLLILTSAFIFNSCGDSDVADKTIEYMEEAIAAADANDIDKFNAATKKLTEYSAELAKDPAAATEDSENLSKDQDEKMAEVTKRYTEAAMKMAKKGMPTTPVTE